MNKQPNKGVSKKLLVGAMALTLSLPIGAAGAYAASYPTTSVVKVQTAVHFQNFDLNAFLQQYIKDLNLFQPTTGTGNAGQATQPNKPVTTQPSKPVTTQPSKPVVTQPSKPVVTQPSKPVVTQPSKPVTTQPSKPVATTPTTPTTSQPSTSTGAGTVSMSEYASQVVTLVNQERAKAGLSPLKATNSSLTLVALDKAKDMYNNNYFDHTSPTYGSPFDMMKQYGVTYRSAGENIAKGQRTPQEVMTAWMNSPGHKANILNASFTTIGVAYYNGVWVQEFIG